MTRCSPLCAGVGGASAQVIDTTDTSLGGVGSGIWHGIVEKSRHMFRTWVTCKAALLFSQVLYLAEDGSDIIVLDIDASLSDFSKSRDRLILHINLSLFPFSCSIYYHFLSGSLGMIEDRFRHQHRRHTLSTTLSGSTGFDVLSGSIRSTDGHGIDQPGIFFGSAASKGEV